MPTVSETIKRTTQPYFVLDGNICALLAAKDHVNGDHRQQPGGRLAPAQGTE